MAILKKGMIWNFSGKLGGIVGYELNGQHIIRAMPVVSKRKASPLEMINRARMKAVSKYLSPIRRAIKFGYQNLAPPGSRIGAFQQAQSYTLKHSLDYDENTVPFVNPEKVLIFRGKLPTPVQATLEVAQDRSLVFSWPSLARAGTHLHLVAFIYDGIQKHDLLSSGPNLSEQGYTWRHPFRQYADKKPIHVYFGFRNSLTGEFSESQYWGSFYPL